MSKILFHGWMLYGYGAGPGPVKTGNVGRVSKEIINLLVYKSAEASANLIVGYIHDECMTNTQYLLKSPKHPRFHGQYCRGLLM